MKKLITIILLAAVTGCSSAGPYVTNISSDGAGGLSVEKCQVKYNGFGNYVSTGDCTHQNLKLGYAR
jgi:type IV secretion system protein VirB7